MPTSLFAPLTRRPSPRRASRLLRASALLCLCAACGGEEPGPSLTPVGGGTPDASDMSSTSDMPGVFRVSNIPVYVGVGESQSCALLMDGLVRCWGRNDRGQLGDGTTSDRTTPVLVNGLSEVISISVGTSHACALLKDSSARCWGDNQSSQLGGGSQAASSSTPVRVRNLSQVSHLSAGVAHTCAVLKNGTASCWGSPNATGGNDGGSSLGDGRISSSAIPVAVRDLVDAVNISAGEGHTCAVLADGTARCWGSNAHGQLGDGTTTSSNVPVVVSGLGDIANIYAGARHTCALVKDGTARCWGRNATGQLGDGTTTDSSAPVRVSGLSNIAGMSAGQDYTCAVLGDGSARCWGSNTFGRLGDGTSSAADRKTPVTVSSLSNTASISAWHNHTCALLKDDTARCWGSPNRGGLGDGEATTAIRTTPVEVALQR